MPSKESLAISLRKNWDAIQAKKQVPAVCFIGFDGFTDEIISAVQQRTSSTDYTPFTDIASFGQRITEAAGKSCNIELVVHKVKLGGNAPIMTNAMLNGGHEITFCGPIGLPGHIEPIFQEMANRCKRVITLGPSAHSDAIEFHDGKVILGKMASLKNVTYTSILTQIPKEELTITLDNSELFVCANWTMLPMMNSLWQYVLDEIAPHFEHGKKRLLFVDLADPAKRTDNDLSTALGLLKKLSTYFKVYLGLNEAEATRISQVLKQKQPPTNTEELARLIQSQSGLHCIVVHTASKAVSVDSHDVAIVQAPYTSTPKMTTGAGDNFNAGYCTGLLYRLSPQECLLTGVATAGYYVRRGQSPTIAQLCDFLRQWDHVSDPQQLD